MKQQNPISALKIIVAIVIYAFIYIVIALCWVGAEYYFEGAVIPSHIDSVVNGMLAFYITQDIVRIDRKYGNRDKHNNEKTGG